MIIRCYAPSLRGVAFLGAATPPTHSPAAAAYIRVLRDDRTDRIESRMIDLNPVTKTKTKHARVPPTYTGYRITNRRTLAFLAGSALAPTDRFRPIAAGFTPPVG